MAELETPEKVFFVFLFFYNGNTDVIFTTVAQIVLVWLIYGT